MKILTDCGLANSRKDGSWIRYITNRDLTDEIKALWDRITTEQQNCICKNTKKDTKCE